MPVRPAPRSGEGRSIPGTRMSLQVSASEKNPREDQWEQVEIRASSAALSPSDDGANDSASPSLSRLTCKMGLTPPCCWVVGRIKADGSQKACRDFPGGTVVKNLPANAGDTGSSPGPGRSHMTRGN